MFAFSDEEPYILSFFQYLSVLGNRFVLSLVYNADSLARQGLNVNNHQCNWWMMTLSHTNSTEIEPQLKRKNSYSSHFRP